MKLAIWTYSTSVALTALVTVALGGMFRNILAHTFGGKPMPRITEFFLDLQWWVLLVALLFIVAAYWLTSRPALTTDRAFMFAGLSTMVIVFLFSLALVSLSLPFV